MSAKTLLSSSLVSFSKNASSVFFPGSLTMYIQSYFSKTFLSETKIFQVRFFGRIFFFIINGDDRRRLVVKKFLDEFRFWSEEGGK